MQIRVILNDFAVSSLGTKFGIAPQATIEASNPQGCVGTEQTEDYCRKRDPYAGTKAYLMCKS
jgi:hypothetical protein